MKSPIVFRCDFRQPKGPVMNPLGIKMNVPIPVEIYHARSAPPQEWRVRRPGTKVLFKIAPQQSPGILQSQIEMTTGEHIEAAQLVRDRRAESGQRKERDSRPWKHSQKSRSIPQTTRWC
jgi:hypothetical protein